MSRNFWGGSLWANFSILWDCKLCGLILQGYIMTNESVLILFLIGYIINDMSIQSWHRWVFLLVWSVNRLWWLLCYDAATGYSTASILPLPILPTLWHVPSLWKWSGLCLFKLHILPGIDRWFLFDYYKIIYAHVA